MRAVLTIDGEKHDVATKAIDTVMAERKYGSVSAKPVESSMFALWNAAKRDGITSDDFDTFLGRLDDFDEVPESPLDSGNANAS